MKIHEMSEQFGLTQDTLRYYEKIGLLDPVKRDRCGQRHYQDNDVKRLEFICCMREAGLTIQLLQKYIELYRLGDETIQQRCQLLIEARDELKKKQSQIATSLEKLNHKIENYDRILKNKKI